MQDHVDPPSSIFFGHHATPAREKGDIIMFPQVLLPLPRPLCCVMRQEGDLTAIPILLRQVCLVSQLSSCLQLLHCVMMSFFWTCLPNGKSSVTHGTWGKYLIPSFSRHLSSEIPIPVSLLPRSCIFVDPICLSRPPIDFRWPLCAY